MCGGKSEGKEVSKVEESRLKASAVMATSGKQSDSDNDRKNKREHPLSALGRMGNRAIIRICNHKAWVHV